MKNRWKQTILAVCCVVLLLVSGTPTAVYAADDVYFVAINDELLELQKDTMPFWSGGELYISNAIFSSHYSSLVGISYAPGVNRETSILYNLKNALFFDMAGGMAYDTQNHYYPARAIDRGNYVFFPISIISAFFGVSYKVIDASPAPVIRLKTGGEYLSDREFVNAAALLMNSRYTAYEKANTPPITTPTITEDPEEETPTYSGQEVYLVVDLTEETATGSLLDVLQRYGGYATFLVSDEEMKQYPDLLRRITAEGHGVALQVEDEASFAAANRLLFSLTRTTTRLVAPIEAAPSGAAAISCRFDVSDRPLIYNSRAESLFQTLSSSSLRRQTVYLGQDTETVSGFSRLLLRLSEANCSLYPYRETL